MATRQTAISISSGSDSDSYEHDYDSADAEREYHKRRRCGRDCCGSPLSSQDEDDGDAETIVTDAHVKQLVVSYKRHFAEHCARKHRRLVQQFPYVVWEKVYADFRKAFPKTNFDVALLKTHMKAGLRKYKIPPPAALYPGPMSLAVARSLISRGLGKPLPAAKVTHAPPLVNAKPASFKAAKVTPAPASSGVTRERMAVVQKAPSAAGPAPTVGARGTLILGATPNGADANSAARVSSINPTQADGSVVKSAQIDPAVATVSTAIGQQLQIKVRNSSLHDNSDPQTTSTDHSTAVDIPASQSDAVSTGSSHGPEAADNSTSQPQWEINLKRRLKANCVELQELKKRKLGLEILSLTLELGIISREECVERGKRVVQIL